MANTDPIIQLLRTNSVSKFLVRRARNKYVQALREILHTLGYDRQLDWRRLGADNYYGEETVLAVRAFAKANTIEADGGIVTPRLALRMVQGHDAIEGIALLRSALKNRQLGTAFQPTDPNNYGTQQLRLMLSTLGIAFETVPQGLREFALQEGIPQASGRELTEPLAEALIERMKPFYGETVDLKEPVEPGIVSGGGSGSGQDDPNPGTDQDTTNRPQRPTPPLEPKPLKELEVIRSANSITVSDGSLQVMFRRHEPQGVSLVGYQSVSNFVADNKDKLRDLDLTPSAIAVVEAVARNEGYLDAINTYDRGFLSLGIYQWTLGRDDGAGELPALCKKLKTSYPNTFRQYFQNFGVDISAGTNTTYGYLTYNGRPVNRAYLKDQFRDPSWAYRFWRATQNRDVQAVEVAHAVARLRNFYWKDNYSAGNYKLNELVTSSYGVALLLDNHVNRPSWVGECVRLGLQQSGLDSSNPAFWSTQEEQRLLNAYLDVRKTYSENGNPPMTKAGPRAEMIAMETRRGALSRERGSFQVSELALRSYSDIPGQSNTIGVAPPPYYDPGDYPDIEMEFD